MGGDGSRSVVALRERGTWTIAHGETTSVVIGVPRVALELGGAGELLPIKEIAQRVARVDRRDGGCLV